MVSVLKRALDYHRHWRTWSFGRNRVPHKIPIAPIHHMAVWRRPSALPATYDLRQCTHLDLFTSVNGWMHSTVIIDFAVRMRYIVELSTEPQRSIRSARRQDQFGESASFDQPLYSHNRTQRSIWAIWSISTSSSCCRTRFLCRIVRFLPMWRPFSTTAHASGCAKYRSMTMCWKNLDLIIGPIFDATKWCAICELHDFTMTKRWNEYI